MGFMRENFGEINVVEVHCNFSIGVWKALYVAAERSENIPVVRVQDGDRQFVVLEAKHFDELQRMAADAAIREAPAK